MTDQTHALVAKGLSKSFGGVHAVRSADLIVPVGERRALIGPNGAGKTTLFNLITGALKTDQGVIEIFGIDITTKSIQDRSRLGLGRTYQISQLLPKLSVLENLYLAGKPSKRMDLRLIKPWRKYEREESGRITSPSRWNYKTISMSRLQKYLMGFNASLRLAWRLLCVHV